MKQDPITDNQLPVLIKASELAEFGFCERAWWLSNVKQVSRQNQHELQRGQTVHIRHEKYVQAAARWSRISMGLFAMGGILLVVAFGLVIFT